MPRLTASEVAALTGGSLAGRVEGRDAEASSLSADSREVAPGVAFAAVAGGHAFVQQAVAAGAPFVIVDRPVEADAPVVIVDDIVRALGALAASVRTTLDVPVIGITGSVGKTLTKDLLAAALGSRKRVHASPKSYNAEIGVPLTMLATPDGTEAIVAELAARHVGEIADLCEIVRPTAGVITGIGTSHLQEFGSRRGIARGKSELLASLPADGLAVVPSNDDFLDVLVGSTDARVVTVGPAGHVRYRADRVTSDGRTYGAVAIGRESVDVVLPIPGRALLRNAAFAIAVAAEHGVDASDAAMALADVRPTSWRMQIVEVDGRTVVNDAWNANPTSASSALRATREMAGDRPAWAVLGRMAELGPDTQAGHERIGRLVRELRFAGLILVGDGTQGYADGYGSDAFRVGSLAEAAAAIDERVGRDAVVVVKASRVVGLERLVDLLSAGADEAGAAANRKAN